MSYLHDLEERWRENGGNLAATDDSGRPAALRGKDFMSELHRLYFHTRDDRFLDAIAAAFDHDLVDNRFHWTNRPLPTEAKVEQTIVDAIEDMIKKCGWSARRSYAFWAAECPIHANSFEAAMKKAEGLHRRLGKNVRHESSNDNAANM